MSEPLKILIIEDEPGILSTIEISLSSEGFSPVSALTGESGLKLISDEIALVLLDIGLPDRSGFEILKEIRQHHATPVLLLTARDSEIDKVLGLELGADDYVVKPFSPRELVARIRAITRRSTKATNDGKSVVTINMDKKLIYYFGKVISLSPYEYKTLALFLKWPGRIFSREEIMDMVWTEPEDSFDRAVDTVIKNIRSRMKEINKDLDPIETRRGQGYGLKENL
jgi:two-component system catabolic regulation response regulator CreB